MTSKSQAQMAPARSGPSWMYDVGVASFLPRVPSGGGQAVLQALYGRAQSGARVQSLPMMGWARVGCSSPVVVRPACAVAVGCASLLSKGSHGCGGTWASAGERSTSEADPAEAHTAQRREAVGGGRARRAQATAHRPLTST